MGTDVRVLLFASIFSCASALADQSQVPIQVKIMGDVDTMERTLHVAVAIKESSGHTAIATFFKDQNGLGPIPFDEKTIYVDQVQAVTSCQYGWTYLNGLGSDRANKIVTIGEDGIYNSAVPGEVRGSCFIDKEKNQINIPSPYFYETVQVLISGPAWDTRNAGFYQIKGQVLPPTTCSAACDSYSRDASKFNGLLKNSDLDQQLSFKVLSRQKKEYLIKQRWIGSGPALDEPDVTVVDGDQIRH